MMKRRGESDTGCLAVVGSLFIVAFVGGVVGRSIGWDAGVRDAVAGRATVIEKPDGTSESVKIKAKESQ